MFLRRNVRYFFFVRVPTFSLLFQLHGFGFYGCWLCLSAPFEVYVFFMLASPFFQLLGLFEFDIFRVFLHLPNL